VSPGRSSGASPARQRRLRTTLGSQAAPFIVVTGLSGAGKSHALRALEDLGYFCVDNLPIALIPTFADLILSRRGPERRKAAVVVDVREGRTLARFPGVYRRLKQRVGRRIRLVFLEASDIAILRRFSETRRPHPLGIDQSLAEGIGEERRLLLPIRRLADQVVDTSSLTVHELRRRILESAGGATSVTPLIVTLVSFGFRRGVPPDADLVFDVRFLPNPNFVPSLRRFNGRHARVARYVMRSRAAKRFLKLTIGLLKFLVPQYIAEGKTYLTIGIGCTGGRHRSVAIAEALERALKSVRGIELRVRHRDALEE
jgi:RNase adapter protein RapZ